MSQASHLSPELAQGLLKERGVAALAPMGSPAAAAALAGAAKTGDRMLRRIAAARG